MDGFLGGKQVIIDYGKSHNWVGVVVLGLFKWGGLEEKTQNNNLTESCSDRKKPLKLEPG